MAVFPASGGPTSSTEFPLELDFALANNVTAKKMITAAATERMVKVLVERLPTRGRISGVAETMDVSLSEVQVRESKAYIVRVEFRRQVFTYVVILIHLAKRIHVFLRLPLAMHALQREDHVAEGYSSSPLTEFSPCSPVHRPAMRRKHSMRCHQ